MEHASITGYLKVISDFGKGSPCAVWLIETRLEVFKRDHLFQIIEQLLCCNLIGDSVERPWLQPVGTSPGVLKSVCVSGCI